MDIDREEGMALVVAMMAMLLLSALGVALILTTSSETMIAGNFRNSQEAFYAADAVVERVMDDLRAVPDWNMLLDESVQSAFIDGSPGGTRTLSDGSTIDLTRAVSMANCQKAASCSAADLIAETSERPWGANNPVWRLYGYGPLKDMMPTDTISSLCYVLVLVGDDPSENDNDPLHDGSSQTNPGSGVLALRAEAFGPQGAHKVIELTVARTDTNLGNAAAPGEADQIVDPADYNSGIGQSGVRILSWREVR